MRILPILITATLLTGAALAQDGADLAVHVTTTMHDDGSYVVTVTDPEKHTSDATTFNAAKKMTQKIVYTLDDQNQAQSGVVYTAANVPVYKAVYMHDGSGRTTEEDDSTMDNQLIRRFVYEFGADGKVSRIRAYDAQGVEMQQSSARKDPHTVPPRRH